MLIVRAGGGNRVTTKRIAFGVWPVEWIRYVALSDNEFAVISMFGYGARVSQIARRMGVRQQTIHSVLKNVRAKLEVETNAEALAVIYGAAILSDDDASAIIGAERP